MTEFLSHEADKTMMMLVVDGINMGTPCSNVIYWVNDYESAFDLLSQLVITRWTLKRAILVDGTTRLVLPIEAFDGQSFQVPMSALQQQWRQILADQPARVSISDGFSLKDWYQQMDTYYYRQLTMLHKMGLVLEAAINKHVTRRNQSLRLQLCEQYDRLRVTNQRMLDQTRAHRQQNQERLARLENK